MCHFVTAVMSADGDENATRRIAKGSLLRWDRIVNLAVSTALQTGESYYFTTRGMCDCGTAIGIANRNDIRLAEPDFVREAKKLRKKGWGEHKIERWLAERKTDYDRKRDEAIATNRDSPFGVQNWVDFIRQTIESGAASSIGLLLHWYSRGLEDERISIKRRDSFHISELTNERLLQVEEDVIYLFCRHRPHHGKSSE